MSNDRTEILRACLTWLYETKQPEGAIITQHGTSRRYGNRNYGVTAAGWNGYPVIVIEVSNWADPPGNQWRGFGGTYSPLPPSQEDRHPAGPCQEMQEAADTIRTLGHEITKMWNGAPSGMTGSIGLAQLAHPSLLAAQQRYDAGCPQHASAICGDSGCHRRWYDGGAQLLVPPLWPAETPIGKAGR